MLLHSIVKPPCKEYTDNVSDDTEHRENRCDRCPLTCCEGHCTQKTGSYEERDDHQRPNRVPCETLDDGKGLAVDTEVCADLNLALLQHIENLSGLCGGIYRAFRPLDQHLGNLRVHLLGMLEVDIKAEAGDIHLVGEGIEYVHFGTQCLEGSFYRNDAA